MAETFLSRFLAPLQPANDNSHTAGSLAGIRGILSKIRDACIAISLPLPYAGINKFRLPEMV
ncbi:hypothetical protein [Microcoleus sp. FACHB-672]|uniref:hypothetical protein n=1 Tax=Microcoleus sp. FACHB-672 TaxID=2692825 RepID=UPI0016878915|nr:hypothetical protein [Microcoleus sp. FACHB-672]MBD2043968.1 hypothetical protein [Microcoleus sp. FACHB-672]